MNICLTCGKIVKNKYCSVSCQNKHQGSKRADDKYGKIKIFNVICKRCDTLFGVSERSKLFPKKEKYYCSRSCSNSRSWDDNDKKKKRDSLEGKEYIDRKITKCKRCNKNIRHKVTKERVFCSKSCNTSYNNLNTDRCRNGGLRSCEIQKDTRRSKNEIYFFELCKEKFNIVLHNVSMFNGWDADVIIEDLKIAIMWNGIWHYEKITKEHCVEKVQKRDDIKIKEIKKMNYIPYVIKDMGGQDKKFVESEFRKFIKYCGVV